nr:MAG TPA: hypothetical protein [Caudoviricetes sp.]
MHSTFSRGFPLPLWGGSLNDRSNCGARCVNANNGVGNARWNILRRLSEFNQMLHRVMQRALMPR